MHSSRFYIGLDDTDAGDSVGTGALARELSSHLARELDARPCGITRHQLLVHPDIPYTSHNSAACVAIDCASNADTLTEICREFVRFLFHPGADPGLCVVEPDRITADCVDFGRRAQREVVTKQEAIDLAAGAGILLEEHGGTGLGVVGAVASINVITRKPTSPFGEVSTEWGPYNNTTIELAHGAPVGKLYYLVTGMLGHSDGFAPSARLNAETRRRWFDKVVRYDLYPLEGPFAATGPFHTFDDVTIPAAEQYIGDDGVWDHQRFSRYQIAPELEVGVASELYYYRGRTNSYEPVAYNSYRGDAWKPNWPYFGDDQLEVKKFALRNRAFV